MLSSVFLGSVPVYIIADMDLVKEITVKHFDKFADRMVCTKSMITMNFITSTLTA